MHFTWPAATYAFHLAGCCGACAVQQNGRKSRVAFEELSGFFFGLSFTKSQLAWKETNEESGSALSK
jgi:hypothetical protein